MCVDRLGLLQLGPGADCGRYPFRTEGFAWAMLLMAKTLTCQKSRHEAELAPVNIVVRHAQP